MGNDCISVKYPPRGAWEIVGTYLRQDISYKHRGYSSKKLKPCPACGRYPVFEEDQSRCTEPTKPAKYFYGFCPTCDLRTEKSGTLKEAVYQWQAYKFSEDTLMVCRRPTFSKDGINALYNKVVEACVNDAISKLEWQLELIPFTAEWRRIGKELDEIEDFLRGSCFTVDLDPDGIISDIRRKLYPDMPHDERTKIPLHLSKLYEGKIKEDYNEHA